MVTTSNGPGLQAQRRGELSALKRPLASLLDDPQFRERFLREAELGRALNHPNIVRILERGRGTSPWDPNKVVYRGAGPSAVD